MCVPILLVFVLIYVYVVGAGFHLGPVSLLFLLYFGDGCRIGAHIFKAGSDLV